MYRVLVVDDEKIIADGICELIKSELYPSAEVSKAYSGKQALEICRNTEIDILLTDVRMPEIDGFALQKEVSGLFPDCSTVFLSAHSDFHYIQSALRSNIVDYVVKTEGDEAIVDSVRKAAVLFEQRKKNAALLENAQKNIQMALPLLRKKYVEELLEGGDTSAQSMETQFTALKMPIDYKMPVLVLIGRIDWHGEGTEPLRKVKNIYGIQNIVDEKLSAVSTNISVEYENDKLVWLIQPKQDGSDMFSLLYEQLIVFISASLDFIQASFQELFDGNILFAFGPKPVSWQELSEEFYVLKSVFHKASGFWHSTIFIQDIDETNEAGLEKYKIRQEYIIQSQIKKVSRLELLLERGEKSEFIQNFDEITNQISQCRKISYELLCETYYAFAMMFMSHINRTAIQKEIQGKVNMDLLMKLDNHSSWESAIDYLKKLAEAIFELEVKENANKMNNIILNIENYIADHLQEDVSLNKISEILHFNPSYLSRIFKQFTNRSVTEYITEIKIKKACELLNNSKLKIYEIAAMTGFESTSYFNRFFKKHFNITPQEYRNKM